MLQQERGGGCRQLCYGRPAWVAACVVTIFFSATSHLYQVELQDYVQVDTLYKINQTSTANPPPEQCLNLEINQDMDSLIASARQVFITFPAKAGGTSMKTFTAKCMNNRLRDNILNNGHFNKQSLISKVHVDSIVSSHLYDKNGLVRLAKYPSRETLMIHIHREETKRVVSGVKHVMSKICNGSRRNPGLSVKRNGTECIFEEGPVVDLIANRQSEVKFATHDILTCSSYEALQDNGPQLVFVNYKQVDKLQALLAKHHCPQLELPVHENIAAEKGVNVFLKLETTGDVISIEDWLHEKGPSLEIALNLRKDASCQAKTFHMEGELFGCPDEALWVTTESIKGW